MVKLLFGNDTYPVTDRMSISSFGISFRVRFSPQSLSEELIDVDALAQTGRFVPLNWNGVTHLKAEGEFVANSQNNHFPGHEGVGISYSNLPRSSSDGCYICPIDFDGYVLMCTGQTIGGIARVAAAMLPDAYGDTALYVYSSFYRFRQRNVDGVDVWYCDRWTGRGRLSTPPLSAVPKLDASSASVWDYAQAILDYDLPYYENWADRDLSRNLYRRWSTYVVWDRVPIDARFLREQIRREMRMLKNSSNRAFYSNWVHSLQATAFDAVNKLQVNLLAFAKDLPETGVGTLKSIKDLLSSPNPRNAASAWLSGRYGDRLAFSDMAEIFKAIDETFLTVGNKTERFIQTKSRASHQLSDGYFDISVKLAAQLALTPKDYNHCMRLIRNAMEWDYYPTLGNVWDMIPLSFVVDWFVNVGDIFESIDRLVQSSYYDVAAILQSIKAEAFSPILSGIKYTYYDRSLSYDLQLAISSVELGLPANVNIIDGAALIVSSK